MYKQSPNRTNATKIHQEINFNMQQMNAQNIRIKEIKKTNKKNIVRLLNIVALYFEEQTSILTLGIWNTWFRMIAT
jgi:hypothetical protein